MMPLICGKRPLAFAPQHHAHKLGRRIGVDPFLEALAVVLEDRRLGDRLGKRIDGEDAEPRHQGLAAGGVRGDEFADRIDQRVRRERTPRRRLRSAPARSRPRREATVRRAAGSWAARAAAAAAVGGGEAAPGAALALPPPPPPPDPTPPPAAAVGAPGATLA